MKVTGFIRGFPNERSPGILVVDGPLDPRSPGSLPNNPGNLIVVADSKNVTAFEYMEAKDLDHPEEVKRRFSEIHGLACLSITLAEGQRLSIFEVEQHPATQH